MNQDNTVNKNKSGGFRSILARLVHSRELGVAAALLVIGTFFFLANDTFLTFRNILNVIRQISELGIIAVAMTILIISREFDLSVGSVFAVTPIVMSLLIKNVGLTVWLAAPASLLLAAGLGLINGLVTVKIMVPSFITTLGTMMVYRGLALILSQGWPMSGLPDSIFYSLAAGRLPGSIPVPIVWLVLVSVAGWIVLHKTSYGFKVYATGGNQEAARLCGINTDRVKITNFILTALAAGSAGIMSLAYLGSATPTQGTGLELEAIAASVIGGTALFGGAGTVFGTFLGATIIGVVRNGLVLMGTSAYWQEALIGLVIVLAVVINVQLGRRRGH
ncbi:ABC transporter permease [candidate division KSB1 bacterium]